MKRGKMETERLKKEIYLIKLMHQNDSELNHKVGKDVDCLYCDKYNSYVESLSKCEKKQIGDKQQNLYEVKLIDKSKHMVFARNVEEIEKFLKVKNEEIIMYEIMSMKGVRTIFKDPGSTKR